MAALEAGRSPAPGEGTNVGKPAKSPRARLPRLVRFSPPSCGLVDAWLDTRHKRVLHLEETQTRVAIAAPLGSPLRLELAVAMLEEMRQQWWRRVLRRYLGAD